MAKKTKTAAEFVPDKLSYEAIKEAAQGCRGCDLYKDATNVVVGDGARKAALMLVGEQPGDQEDQAGEPFVGPAGSKLDEAIAEAGLDRGEIYVTNAVKHFKFETRGSRRIHKSPNVSEIKACRPWLAAEIQVVKPRCIVSLGSKAARSVMGKSMTISKSRGEVYETDWGPQAIISYHPSAALRHPYPDERERIFAALIEDLRLAQSVLG